MSTDRGMDKEVVVCRYAMEYYSAIKKEWSNATCSDMGGPRDGHTEGSKSNRERETSYDIPFDKI